MQHKSTLLEFRSELWVQVDGVQRLASLLQTLAARRSSEQPTPDATNGSGRSGSTAGNSNSSTSPKHGTARSGSSGGPLWAPLASQETVRSLTTAANILQWIASEMSGLSEKERRVALNMPVDLAARLTSRAAARTVKFLAAAEDTDLAQGAQKSKADSKKSRAETTAAVSAVE